MGDVKIRNLPDWIVAKYKNIAEHEGKSLEETLGNLITETAVKRRQASARRAKDFQDKLRKKYGVLSDSTPGIRADRQSRG